MNPAFAVDVVRHLVDQVKPSFMIADANTRLEVVGVLIDSGTPVNVTVCIEGGVIPGSLDFADEVESHSSDEPVATIHGDDIYELLFTSGTTAMPKAVMLSHIYAYLASYGFALSCTRGLDLESQVCMVSFLPIVYHIGDQVLALPALMAGGKLVIGRRSNPEAVADAVVKHAATVIWGGAPQSIKQISFALEKMAPQNKTLTVMFYGWGAVEPEVIRRLESWSRPAFQLVGIFGQTEAIACHRFWPASQRSLFEATGSSRNLVGVPSPLLASTIEDGAGADLVSGGRINQPGEVVYRSPLMMAGYYRDPEATARAFEGGWFHSGDSCMITEDGVRVMIDRYNDIIKSGGENVSSMRVEARLHAHPGMYKSAVVGLAHTRWDEAVTAFVVRGKVDVDERELLDWARAGLAGFETPKRIVFVEALPETVGGKVMKHKLRTTWANLYGDSDAPSDEK